MASSGFISSDMPVVSVIVPVYNAEQFLSQCIDSILCQSFNCFELLLIDDGSTDRSGHICDEYSEKDNRVIVFHKDNAGVCSARNKGLEEARGKYIIFIDADDHVNTAYIEHLMSSDSDLVITGAQRFNTRNDSIAPLSTSSFSIEELPSHWNTKSGINLIYCLPFAKRFRSSIIQKNGIRFDENLFYSEDMLFNMRYLIHSDSCFELPSLDYMYRIEDISRNRKFRMSANDLAIHYTHINDSISDLEQITGYNSFSSVRDDVNLRLLRKFYYYLLNCSKVDVFVENIKSFRNQSWASYMLHLLNGKKEKRIMNGAMLFPHLTYQIEIRLRKLFNR